MVLEEAVHVVAEVVGDQVRDLGAQHDAEARRADVPAHGALGVGVQAAAVSLDDRGLGGPACVRGTLEALAGATTAAAPSPKRPLATRLATDVSSRCTVSEHSSTESRTATWSG